MKKTLLTLHKWTGISLFLLFFLQGLTGFIMTHKETFIPLSFGTHLQQPETQVPVKLDTTITNLTALYPNQTLDRIIYPNDRSLPLIARMKSSENFWLTVIYIDRPTGHILSHGPLWQYPTQLAERLHVSLLFGVPGNVALMIEGLILALMAISGLIIWWPRKGGFSRSLRITFQKGMKRFVRDIHVVPAALLAPLMIIVAITGFLNIAEPLVRPIIALFAPVGPELSVDLTDTARPETLLSWHKSMEQLENRFDHSTVSQLRFLDDDRLLGAVIHAENFTNPRAHHIAGVDRYTGETIILSEAGAELSGDAFMEWFLPVHSGEIWGPFREILYSLLGLVLCALSITGIIMWQQRRPKKR